MNDHLLARRDLFRLASLAGLGCLAPQLFAALPDVDRMIQAVDWDRSLVLIEFDGGNDGLNTLIPVEDDLYYDARAANGLAIGKSAALPINGSDLFRLHPRLAHCQTMFNEGDLAIVHGVGYAQSNRSHFRGIDIWNTGSDAHTYLDTGWLGRIVAGTTVPPTIVAESSIQRRAGSNPIEHPTARNLAMSNPRDFIRQGASLDMIEEEQWAAAADRPGLLHLLTVHEQVRMASDAFATALTDGDPNNYTPPSYTVAFPSSDLGRQLNAIADIICSGIHLPIHKAAFGSFDNHANQVDAHNPSSGTHANLLGQLDDALHAFRSALIEHGKWNECLIMTYSEFGRRLAANASRGTDHGGASCHFAWGGRVNGGLHGSAPSLEEEALTRGDPTATLDFRQYYSAGAHFLGFDPSLAFPTLPPAPPALATGPG